MPIALAATGSVTATSWIRLRFTTPTGFIYDASALPISLDVTRGRTDQTEATIAGASCSATFDDPTGILDVDNTTSPLNGLLTPGSLSMTTVRADHYVASLNQYFPLFTGRIDSLDRSFTQGSYSETAATFLDSTPELIKHIPKAGTVLPQELPGSRIQRLLSTASRSGFVWQTRALTAPLMLDTGQKMLGKYVCDGNTSSWDIAAEAAASEGGLLYFDQAGVLVFHGQSRRLVNSVAWNLTDTIKPDATPDGIEYQDDLALRISTDNQIVDAAVTSIDGVTSVYGPGGATTVSSTGTFTADLTETSQVAGNITGAARAKYLVGSRSVPKRHAPVVTVNPSGFMGVWTSPNGQPTAYQMAVRAGIDDLCQLTRHPKSGSTITAPHWVEGFTHHLVNDGTWLTSFNVSRSDPVPPLGYWLLGVSNLGRNTTLTW